LITGDGKQHDVELLDFYWHPYLLVLNFSAEGWSKHTVIILPDNAPAGAVRRLRVRLQLQRSEATAG
jgi:hypothetical protein